MAGESGESMATAQTGRRCAVLGLFVMADGNFVVIDAVARPLEIEAGTLREAAAILERAGFVEFDRVSVQQDRCWRTRDRRLRALARQIISSGERRVR